MNKHILILKLILFINVLLILSCGNYFSSEKKPSNSTELKPAPSYFLSPDGNDAADGSFDNPWHSFKFAITQLLPGDKLSLMPGIYKQEVNIDVSGLAEKPILIAAYNEKDKPLIEDPYPDNDHQALIISGSNLILKNIKVNGCGQGQSHNIGAVIVIPPWNGTKSISNIVIDGFEVYQASGSGIEIRGQYVNETDTKNYSNNVTVKNSIIYNNSIANENGKSTSWDTGLKAGYLSRIVIFQNNRIYENWGEGVGTCLSENVTILNNTVYDNFSVNIYIDNSVSIRVYRNFCYTTDSTIFLREGERASGISSAEEDYDDGTTPDWGNQLRDIQIINNIVYNCYRSFEFFGAENRIGGIRNSVVAHNLFYNSQNWAVSVLNGLTDIYNGEENSLQIFNNIIHAKDGQSRQFYIYGNTGSQNPANSDDQRLLILNNLWVDGEPRYWDNAANDWSYSAKGDGDIYDVEPNFLAMPDYIDSSFILRSDCLAVNSGVKTNSGISELTADYRGGKRDANPDIGPFEN